MKHTLILFLWCTVFLVASCKDKMPDEATDHLTSEPQAESNDIERIEPPYWWTGFKNRTLQLLVKHPNIGSYTPQITSELVTLKKIHTADSPNYLFIDLELTEEAISGKFNIVFSKENEKELIYTYHLKSREKSPDDYVGFNSTDAIYLITPDRFANANPANDKIEGMLDQSLDRTHGYKRHGGDLEGISEHLNYIADMGFTAIWSCPVLTNDMPEGSYHGYAITDYYQVDPRFGTLKDYIALAKKTESLNMKLIMDQVANHCGLEHWWMKDLPFKDWVNFQEHYEQHKTHWDHQTVKTSNHRRTTNQDIYASETDKQGMTDGWFVSGMPDLNQRNPFMASYIIQNSIWWIETLGLGGIRQDTYPYPDKDFMSQWAGAIMTEYPKFSIVGEEWSSNPLLIAYWQNGHKNADGYSSNLRSTMDFAMQETIVKALNNEESWGTGLVELYQGLANDFSYTKPEDIMVFPDNHDMSRIFTQLKGEVTNTKMALSYMLMMPRIPQVYYGTEILMDDFEKPGDHGLIRTDFPGGWSGDTINAFTGEGLTTEQKDMQAYLKKILNYRKHSKAIHHGGTKHFAPENGVYVLVRTTDNETVVHILNKNQEPYQLELSRFEELGLKGKQLRDIVSGALIIWDSTLTLDTKGSLILTTGL